MRKWLVGLLAASLCATSALAVTDTLTADDFAATSTTYTEFSNVTKDSPAVYAGKSSKSKDGAIQLRTTGSDCGIVTTASGGTATKVTVTWAEGNAEGRTVDVYGKTEAYSSAADLFASATQGQSLGSIALGTTELAIEGDYSYIGLRSKSGALYLSSVEIEWGGEPAPVEFSIALKPDEDFEVVQGKSASITATVKGAQGDVTYSWSVDGTPIDLAGNVYEIDSAEVGGPYEVTCEADDGVSEPVSASVSYTVVEAPVVTGDVLTRESTGVTGSSYKDWTATGDSGTVYAGQSAGGNDSIQLRTTSPAGIVITESAGSDVASVTVEWHDATAEGRSIQIYGSADAYAGPADLYGDAKGELLGTLAKGETTLAVPEGYPYVGILAKGGALYLTSVAFEFAGEAGLTVTLDKANGFTVDLGTADSITATAKNGTEPYEYVWSSDTAELNGTGETLDIPATLAEGDYTVQVEVTDAEANKASKQIGFSVVAPAVKYPITIADGIENGEITVDKTEAEEGETVTVTATPADGFALEAITVNGIAISATTFPMPAEAVEVGATFAEVKDYAELPFIAEDTPYTGPWKGANVSGMTSKGLGNDYTSGGAVGARLDDTGDWLQIKFQGTAGELSYGIKGNSLSEEKPSTFKVQESADGETWADLATFTTGDNLTGSTVGYTNEVSASSQFVRFFYEEKGAGNVGIYDVYITSGGPAVFSITLDPAEDFEVEQNAEAFVTAIPKHAAEGVVGYAWWIDGTPVDTDGEVLALATAELGPHKVVCDATDASGAEADAHVIYTVVAPAVKYAVNVALGIQNGSVATDVSEAAEGDTVTVTATPVDGYRLVEIIVNNGDVAVSGSTFVMPAQDVLVTATFEEKPVVAGFTKITSLSELEEGEYVITGAKAEGEEYAMMASISTGSTKFLERREAAVTLEEDTVTDAEDSIIWTLAKDGDNWTIYNEAVGYAGYVASGNSAGAEAEASDKSKWTITASETAGLFLLNNVGNDARYLLYNSGSPRFACYTNLNSAKQLALYKGSSGPVAFSIALDPAEDFEVVQGKDAAITATVRGAQGEVSYSWSVNGTPIDLAGNVYAIDSAEVGGPFTVVCEASDGVSDPVSASVSYSVVEAPPVTGDEFELVTSVDDLEDGAEYVITDNSKAYAMKAELSTGSTKRLLNEPVEPVDDVITTDDATIIWKLVEDADGNYAIYNESAGKYIGWSSGNSAKFQDEAFANTISYEDDLFVVTATSTAELDKPRKLQFNSAANALQFAYYEGTQKNLNFFKKAGASSPKIVYSGETSITLGESFEIVFGLQNYDGQFEWVVDSREGGAIAQDGLYTWTPTEAGDVTIKVVARNGGLDIASKEVPLTVAEPGPQPGEPALVFGGDSEGTVGTPVNFTVTAVNVSDPTVYLDGFEFPADSSLTDGDITKDDSNVSFTPDVAGDYVFNFSAGEGDEYVEDTLTVTVIDEPGPQPGGFQITGLTKTGDNLVLTFQPEGTPAVLGTDSLASPQEWTPVEGATVSGTTATVPMGTQNYIRLQ